MNLYMSKYMNYRYLNSSLKQFFLVDLFISFIFEIED